MSWLSSFLNPGQGYDEAQKKLDEYYNQAQGNLKPYNQNGLNAYGGLNTAMGKLLDPAALQDEWNKTYQESDYAKQNEAMAQQNGLNAASSMGIMGSTPALQAIQAGTSGIGAKDRQQYLDDLMKKYMAGIGIGQDIYGKGANAAGQMSQNAMTQGENSATNAFGKTNASGNLFGNLVQGAASFATPLGMSWAGNKLGLQPWSTSGGK